MEIKYEAVIGLEVHAQLLTNSKAFCGCSTQYGAYPNTNTCPICLGHPGTLPTLNKNLVEYIVRMGIATNCKIRELSTFSRKNYFYPDLPKGYQISQYEDPICHNGFIQIELQDGTLKNIGITRIHMEEDSGKSIHDLDIDSLIDLNRSGVPLIEIVSEPDIRSSSEAYLYLMAIKQTVMYLGICNGNMEEGSLRCDVNISVRPIGQEKFGTKVEIKNLNSFRNVEKAIEYEIKRQIEEVENGNLIVQQTRLWDANKNETKIMRTKEMAHDYRYFPEPDLLKVKVTQDWIDESRKYIPELPLNRKLRLMNEYSIPNYDAQIMIEDKSLADYFEKCCVELQSKNEKNYKLVSNWIMTEVLRILAEKNVSAEKFDLEPKLIAELVELYAEDVISSRIAKEIFPEILATKQSPRKIVEEKGLIQNSDTGFIDEIVKKLIDANPDNVEKYRSGRNNLLGFFVGSVMKETQGKANPKIVTEIVKKYLEA